MSAPTHAARTRTTADPPKGAEVWTATEGGFTCALDLVRYIRANYGDYFSIAVAGELARHGQLWRVGGGGGRRGVCVRHATPVALRQGTLRATPT
jgi:hypothetical protein